MTDPHQSQRLRRAARSVAGLSLGGIIGLVAMLTVWRLFFGETGIPALTADRWQQSLRQWTAAGVRDYDLEISVTGRQAATYSVQVRNGQVSSLTHNGDPLPHRRT